nr:MAG TPA: hypothetical protein [Caudoviricetes sp.]
MAAPLGHTSIFTYATVDSTVPTSDSAACFGT